MEINGGTARGCHCRLKTLFDEISEGEGCSVSYQQIKERLLLRYNLLRGQIGLQKLHISSE